VDHETRRRTEVEGGYSRGRSGGKMIQGKHTSTPVFRGEKRNQRTTPVRWGMKIFILARNNRTVTNPMMSRPAVWALVTNRPGLDVSGQEADFSAGCRAAGGRPGAR